MADVWRLIWAPWKLPRAAVAMTSMRATLIAATAGWSLLITAGFMGSLGYGDEGQFWGSSDLLRRLIGSGIVGVGMGIAAVLVILFLLPHDADLTTSVQRARRRVPLLLPWCLVAPAWVWATAAALSNFWIVRILGLPSVIELPATWIGSLWIPVALLVALIMLLFRSVAHVGRMFAGDRCIACGYLLKGLSDRRCPECGQEFAPEQLRRYGEPTIV